MTVVDACKFCRSITSDLRPAKTGGKCCVTLRACAERMLRARTSAAYSSRRRRASA